MAVSLPVEPLERWARAHLRPASQAVADQEEGAGRTAASTIGDAIGVGYNTVNSWRNRHGIPLYTADRIACSLGLHPVDIWSDWYVISGGCDTPVL